MRHFLLSLLAAVPAAATSVSIPVVAPVQAPVGAVSVEVRPTLPSALEIAPNLTPGLSPLALPAAAVPQAVDLPAEFSSSLLPAAEAPAVRAQTAQTALSGVAAEIEAAQKTQQSPIAAAPALERTFDGSAVRVGEPAPVDAAAAPAEGAVSQRGPPQRDLRAIKELKVGTYNMLNLFEKVGDHIPDPQNPGKLKKVSDKVAKEDWQLRDQAKAILDSGLDIVSVEEVENIRALEDFNKRYLGGAYKTLLIEGNDERGIDIAFLVKKDIPVELEHRTHKGETWHDPILGQDRLLFSRDLPSLIVRAPGQAKPLFVLLGTHFKSKRDRPGDPESETVRRAQVVRTAELVARYRAEFGDDVPLMLAGDFNGDLNREDSFAPLWKQAGLTNSLELGDAPVPADQRVTHTYHPKGGPAHAAQMDGILVSEGMKKLVRRSEIYRYRDAQGKVKPIPKTYEERSKNPSDHFPLLVTLDFQPLVGRVLGKAPKEAAPAVPQADPLAGLAPVMKFQSEVIAAAAHAMGGEFPVVSMLLAMLPNGPTLADWSALKVRFEALGAGRAEIWAAVGESVRSAGLRGKLAPGTKPDRDALELFAHTIKEADRDLVILRNNRYLSWQNAWRAGDKRAADVSFEGASARLDGEDLHLDLGAVRIGKDSFPLQVTLATKIGGPGAVEKFLRGLLSSPLLRPEHRAQLAPLTARLKDLGLLPAGAVL